MLSNHLKNLLVIHKRVIVPELGAFLLKSEDIKSVYFNEFLRFNDGLLLGYIAEQEHIDVIDAARMIKAFTDETNASLQAGRSVEVEGIGVLYLDVNDKIQIRIAGFTDRPADKGSDDPKVTDTIEDKTRQLIAELVVPYTHSSDQEPENIPETVFEEPTKSPVVKPNQSDSFLNPKKIIITAGMLVMAAVLAYLLVTKQTRHAANRKDENKYQDSMFEQIAAIKKSDSISNLKAKHANDVQSGLGINAMKSKPPEEDGAASANVLSKPEPIAQTPEIADKQGKVKKYYIIAGCFSEEVNAHKLVARLKSQGYPSENFATMKNLHYVSYSSYFDKDSARQELKKLKAKGLSDAWIMPHRFRVGK